MRGGAVRGGELLKLLSCFEGGRGQNIYIWMEAIALLVLQSLSTSEFQVLNLLLLKILKAENYSLIKYPYSVL